MCATVREATYGPDQLRQGQAQRDEFAALRDGQPGFVGRVPVDAGDGRTLTLALRESEAHAAAARVALEPAAQRLLGPRWTTPSRVIAPGPVLRSDLVKV
jgi:hypothetical protein